MKDLVRVKISKLRFFYLLVLGLVFAIFATVAYLNFQIKKQIPQYNIFLNPISFSPQDYPTLINSFAPFISAQGAIVLDRDSGVVLFEKNSTLRFSPASTTKIMTAIVAIEYFASDDILTIRQKSVEGSTIDLTQGEEFRFEDLLYAMMLPSANDATLAISQNYPGGESAFVAKMNEKTSELGLESTHYEDPIGLLDERDYTTPQNLARLASVALRDPEFSKVVATKKKVIYNTKGKDYRLENLNALLDIPGVNGVKTGFTEGAGQVLVTSRRLPENNKDIIIVVMQSLDRFEDTKNLLNFLENNITYQSIRPQ